VSYGRFKVPRRKRLIVCTYRYEDECGRLLYQLARYDP
jgi:hypothetical protein